GGRRGFRVDRETSAYSALSLFLLSSRTPQSRAAFLMRRCLIVGDGGAGEAHRVFFGEAQRLFGFGQLRHVEARGFAEAERGGQVAACVAPPFAQVTCFHAEAPFDQPQDRGVVERLAANVPAGAEPRT